MQNQIEEILSSGYESPIKTVIGEAKTEIENDIYRAVCQIDIRVDKDELLRALQYDRGQYDKGFADGVRQGQQGWISVEERLPEDTCACLFVDKLGGVYFATYSGRHRAFNATDEDDGDEYKNVNVTHWMPLPPLPKGE